MATSALAFPEVAAVEVVELAFDAPEQAAAESAITVSKVPTPNRQEVTER